MLWGCGMSSLKKMDQSVFENAPHWAQWAAVDKSGLGAWYEKKPELAMYRWVAQSDEKYLLYPYRFDASDWKNSLIERKPTTDALSCDLCGADAGDDPYHATMGGNCHVHICAACFDPQQHDVAVLRQQRDELLKALKRWIWLRDTPAGFVGKYGKSLIAALDEREAQLSEAEAASRAAIAKAGGES